MEVLAAVMILSVAMLAIISAMAASHDIQRRAHYIAIGRNIAQSKIEELRAVDADKYWSITGISSDTTLPSGNSISVKVSEYPVVDKKELYLAQVVVTWPEGQGVREVTYETLIAKR